METLGISFIPTLKIPAKFDKTQYRAASFLRYKKAHNSSVSLVQRQTPLFSTISSSSIIVTTNETENPSSPQVEIQTQDEKFDWYAQWYPLMPICDLDKRAPHAKKVLGIDVMVWWDRNENTWKVFDDACPHRLAPLSEGRIDQWGTLQCDYHGWCLNGSGDCKFIPQATHHSPPVHTSKKACAGVYPSTVQNGILWFWPSSDPRYKDILTNKKPPYIPELDDPSFTCLMANREIPYGYEVLIENFMDPAHAPYAHYGILHTEQLEEKADREGGRPMDLSIPKLDTNGFTTEEHNSGQGKFIPPCLYYTSLLGPIDKSNVAADSSRKPFGFVKPAVTELFQSAPNGQKRALLVFYCIPVSPGHSRLIFTNPRNFGISTKILPRWVYHMLYNLIVDSDMYLLHLEERKIIEAGITQWEKVCFMPTKSDAIVISFRKWLNKYAGGQVDWRGKFNGVLPPTPHREKLFDRYWSHVVNCRSCNTAHKALSVLKVVLQVASFSLLGVVSAMKQGLLSSVSARTALLATALLSFVGSKGLAHFIYKVFHFHDYNHALL